MRVFEHLARAAVPRNEMKSVLGRSHAQMERHLPGNSSLGISSAGLGWNGFAILEYLGDRGERPDLVHERFLVGLYRRNIATGERTNGRGGYVPYARYPNTVTLLPPTIIREHIAHNPYEVMLCFLEPAFVQDLRAELDHYFSDELPFQPNVDDPPMRQLITLLASEAEQGGPLGKLYADHLAHSIGLRLFFLSGRIKQAASRKTATLPRHLLTRVLERMNDLNSELDLKSLAAEIGYSRSHFLRMFRTTMGRTPHHYLIQRRVQRAQELIRLGAMPLIDVAAHCGFSSHAHMSRIFRQMLGVSPSQYRRNL